MAEPAPWPFRRRKWLFGCIYTGGFALGALIDGRLRRAAALPAYAALGAAVPALGPRAWLAAAFGFGAAGFALRVWGSAYLGGATVWSDAIETHALQLCGPFRFTRNPLYLGTVMLSAGAGLLGSLPALALIVAGNAAACVALARAEEPRLRAAFGERYERYERAVPRFLPRLHAAEPAPEGPRASLRVGLAAELRMSGSVLALAHAATTGRPGSRTFWCLLGAGPLAAVLLEASARLRPPGRLD